MSRDDDDDDDDDDTPPSLPAWLARMFPPNMRRRMIHVGEGQRMHVAEWGAPTGRPVLMMHGNPSWCFLYRKVVAELLARDNLSSSLRFIVPDLIGLGCSDKPRDPSMHTLPSHSAWLGRMIDQLDLRDILFVGQDWGGPIGMHALSSRMDRLSAMVILNTVLGPPREGFRPSAFHRFAQTPIVSDIAFRVLGFPQNLMLVAQGDRRSILGKTALGYWWPLRHVRDRAAPMALARMVPDSMHHASIEPLRVCEEAARSFSQKGGRTALVWGDRDPVLGRVFNHMQRLLTHGENPRVTRTSGGHFLQEEVPREIADAVARMATATQI